MIFAKLSPAKPQFNPNWAELALVSFDPAGHPHHHIASATIPPVIVYLAQWKSWKPNNTKPLFINRYQFYTILKFLIISSHPPPKKRGSFEIFTNARTNVNGETLKILKKLGSQFSLSGKGGRGKVMSTISTNSTIQPFPVCSLINPSWSWAWHSSAPACFF